MTDKSKKLPIMPKCRHLLQSDEGTREGTKLPARGGTQAPPVIRAKYPSTGHPTASTVIISRMPAFARRMSKVR